MKTIVSAERLWELWKNGRLAECDVSAHPLGLLADLHRLITALNGELIYRRD